MKKSRKNTKLWISISLLILVIFIGIGVMLYPILAARYAELVRSEIQIQYEEVIQEADTSELDAIRESAIAYNERYFRGEIDPLDPAAYGYFEELVLPDTEVMAYVIIPKLGLTLPVYHGIGDDALSQGCGHMPQSSLPVGGINTHTVISAHTGMAESPMFSDLELIEIGDIFHIHVLGEYLTYEVESVSVVLPQEVNTVMIRQGKDLATLITCTPYGVNTHRLLVTGTRIATPAAEETEPTAAPDTEEDTGSVWLEQYWHSVKIGIFISGAVVILILLVLLFLFIQKRRARRDA